MGTSEERLLARARRLAERIDDAPAVDRDAILVFRVRNERFALRMTAVSTVVPFGRVTPVPTAERFVLGVMAIHGETHAVYALDRMLNLPGASDDDNARGGADGGQVLALRDPARRIGIRVDAVETIDAIDAAPPRSGRHFVRPVHSEPLVLIEDLNAFFNPVGDKQ